MIFPNLGRPHRFRNRSAALKKRTPPPDEGWWGSVYEGDLGRVSLHFRINSPAFCSIKLLVRELLGTADESSKDDRTYSGISDRLNYRVT